MKLALNFLDRFRDFGLLILRVGLGLVYILVHGGPKLMEGPERWAQLGGAMELIGIEFLPAFWGFIAAFAESVGALLIAVGFLTRPAFILLALTMLFAAGNHHFMWEDDIGTTSHALKMAFVFIGMIFVGPGRFSVDQYLRK